MVPQRYHIGPTGADLVEMLFRQAPAMAGILAIDHHEIEAMPRNQVWQAVGDAVAAGAADDVSQEQQSHAVRSSWVKKRMPVSVTTASSGIS